MSVMLRIPLLIALTCLFILSTAAQGDRNEMLARINTLRLSLGLPAYTLNGALNAAALNHARWLARTGQSSHFQEDNTGPRTRAKQAGFSSNWVSENYYLGSRASAQTAWNWWLNSPAHYAGITSPNYDNIGIASVSGDSRNAFVLVFGNSSGRLPASQAGADTSAGRAVAPAAPSYVVGRDEVGNIMHEVQAGDTMGEIALLYGYTWADIKYMLEINSMTEEDIRLLKPGSVFLVPPKDGTFTPSPAPATATPSLVPTAESATDVAATAQPATARPTALIRIGTAPQRTPTSAPKGSESQDPQKGSTSLSAILTAAAVAQAGIIAAALFELMRRSH